MVSGHQNYLTQIGHNQVEGIRHIWLNIYIYILFNNEFDLIDLLLENMACIYNHPASENQSYHIIWDREISFWL